MGGKSRKTGNISRALIDKIKGEKEQKNSCKKIPSPTSGGLDLEKKK